MTTPPSRWRARARLIGAATVAAIAASAITLTAPTSATAGNGPGAPAGSPVAGDASGQQPDIDNRPAAVAPTAAQLKAADQLASDARAATRASATFNRFGALKGVDGAPGAALASGLGDDSVAAARAYISRNAVAFGLAASDVSSLEEVAVNPIGESDVVMLRQTVSGTSAGLGGLVVVAVENGTVRYVSSSLAPLGDQSAAKAAPALNPVAAVQRAASHIGANPGVVALSTPKLPAGQSAGKWISVTASGLFGGVQKLQRVVVPVPGKSARPAYHVVLRDAVDSAYSVYIDANSGDLISRQSLVNYDSDNPRWKVFNSTPRPASSADTRVQWCWISRSGCGEVIPTKTSQQEWDVDAVLGTSTMTTIGNNAITGERWNGAAPAGPATPVAPKQDRNYIYPWTNQWQTSRCSPGAFTSPQRGDIDAATANLFAMHNRMRDWSYNLGFTESAWNLQAVNPPGTGGLGGDPEQGYAQSGALTESRNNANQATLPDGVGAFSNMYLWQPLAGGFYSPCVDGDYDMSVIGHEYGHAISNRMAGGPNDGLSGLQAGAMGESWSDLMANEYLQEWGYVPVSTTATPMGAYVTGSAERGIRNYNFSKSPLNYSNVGYDLTGPQVHADGEIWSATQGDVRAAFMNRYGTGDKATQRSCANGDTEVTKCPGNRRWMQLVADAWLLMPEGTVSMVDARDAMLVADALRFGGANQNILWNAFAARGIGDGAASNGPADHEPTPSFASPHANNGTVWLQPVDERGAWVADAKLYVGEYAARSVPAADNDDSTDLGRSFSSVPGEFTYTITAPGKMQTTTKLTVKPGSKHHLRVVLKDNLASSAMRATVAGTGTDITKMIDGDEGTTATTVDAPTPQQKIFTVDLAGREHEVSSAQVSTLIEPATATRFQALRQFKISACDALRGVDCSKAANYRTAYTSAPDAFPGTAPRPVAPVIKMRTFTFAPVKATHLRVELVKNQCQGGPDFQGDQDNDPNNNSDCTTGFAGANKIAITEVQVPRR